VFRLGFEWKIGWLLGTDSGFDPNRLWLGAGNSTYLFFSFFGGAICKRKLIFIYWQTVWRPWVAAFCSVS
jgi:hypothetical protein